VNPRAAVRVRTGVDGAKVGTESIVTVPSVNHFARSTVMSTSVCVSVCLSVGEHISGTESARRHAKEKKLTRSHDLLYRSPELVSRSRRVSKSWKRVNFFLSHVPSRAPCRRYAPRMLHMAVARSSSGRGLSEPFKSIRNLRCSRGCRVRCKRGH